MAIGVQAGPDQIADGADPSKLASVVTSASGLALQTLNESVDPAGFVRPGPTVDSAGRAVLSDTDKWTLILLEMRLHTFYLAEIAAGRIVNDEPDALRQDFDATGLLASLS